MHDEKIRKIQKTTPVPESRFLKCYRLEAQHKYLVKAFIHWQFFIMSLVTKSKYDLRNVLLLIARKSSNSLHSANIISSAGICCDRLRSKSWRLNETRIFPQSGLDRYISPLNLELEQTLFYVKNLPSSNTANFIYYLSYIITMKNFVIFFFTL